MAKCSFCGKDEHDFIGVHLIKNDGNVDYFCSGKCQKNSIKLGRDKRKVRWTEAFLVARTKDEKKAESEKKK